MSASYVGDILTICNPNIVDFNRTSAVVVEGSPPNPCGHMMINLGGTRGWYFHVAQFYHYPRYMGYKGYLRYLKENSKNEFLRRPVNITKPTDAILKMEELMSKKWLWGLIPHNCTTFVEDIINAGGGNFGLISNCPYLLELD